MGSDEGGALIPRSTTLTDSGRRTRAAILWAGGAVVSLVVLAVLFTAFDRSTVVDGPTGSSNVTTATGLAALHDVLERDGRRPARLTRPLTSEVLAAFDTYLVADARLPRYEAAELEALVRFVRDGGAAVVLGMPPQPLLSTFEIDLDWVGRQTGEVRVADPDLGAGTIEGSRFGAFPTGHDGTGLATSDGLDLAVRFQLGAGSVVFVADASIAHNATVARADNIDFLGALLPGRTLFDEYRHGYDDTPAAGLVSAAPGNWTGALYLGAVVLVFALVSYGRRFGPVEPGDGRHSPDRREYIDAVARSLRRTGDDPPLEPLRAALRRELGLAPEATPDETLRRVRQHGLEPALVDALAGTIPAAGYVLDEALATLTTRRQP